MNEPALLKALGPLAPFYTDPMVTEIMVDAPHTVYVERQGQLEDTGVQFDAPEAIRALIDAALALGDVTLTAQQTMGEVRLPDGARLIAVVPPTAVHSPTLIIRKMPAQALTWEKLLAWESITPEALATLQQAIHDHASLLIVGDTGSGKTTVANLLAGSIPAAERVVVVEEIHEMRIQHPRHITLEAGGPAGLSMVELLRTAARMRPNWLIVSELRGPEAMSALQLMSMGHSGMATIHATSPEDALARLETMCLMANLGLGLMEIRALIASALQLITFQQRQPDGKRKLVQIVALQGVENGRYVLNPIFRHSPGGV